MSDWKQVVDGRRKDREEAESFVRAMRTLPTGKDLSPILENVSEYCSIRPLPGNQRFSARLVAQEERATGRSVGFDRDTETVDVDPYLDFVFLFDNAGWPSREYRQASVSLKPERSTELRSKIESMRSLGVESWHTRYLHDHFVLRSRARRWGTHVSFFGRARDWNETIVDRVAQTYIVNGNTAIPNLVEQATGHVIEEIECIAKALAKLPATT